MKFKAYTYDLTKQKLDIIKKVAAFINNKIEVEILEPPLTSDRETVLFLFGGGLSTDNLVYLAKINLPEVINLDKEIGNPEERKQAYQKLISLKQLLDSRQITKKTTEEATSNISEILGKSEDLTFKVSKSLEKSADVNLTIQELELLKKFMDIFKLSEVEVVYKNNTSRNTK